MRCRSLLYTPGDRGDRLQRAWRDGAADIVCADLEDAVAPERKAEARRTVLEALLVVDRSASQRAVRTSPWGTDAFLADVAAVLEGKPDLLVLPKAQAAQDVKDAQQHVAHLCKERKQAPPRLIPILETALGVLDARAIAAVPGIAAVCFGAEDLAADAGLRRTPTNTEVLTARQLVVLACAAAGVPALDMITADVKDLARTAAEAAEARSFGFSGKMCIHPAQAIAIHQAFHPTAAEVAWARKVMGAVEASGVERGGVIVVDGQMVDVPVIRQAERILALL
ncbi:MAG: citrate lyase subunit beta / citryl-CoA lyase [Thermoplasmata archaeon]|jgi:citrate lyase subunit beta/citryl-CoA lyase|nr:citrate lyase subunit beta / citryl-CoA lyase [Thermoplasmata archaeon]